MRSAVKGSSQPVRCAWASGELAIRYHDEEWGVPVHDDRTLFEFLVLDGVLPLSTTHASEGRPKIARRFSAGRLVETWNKASRQGRLNVSPRCQFSNVPPGRDVPCVA